MTKLDVLSGIKKLKVATHYEFKGKNLYGQMPQSLDELAFSTVKYTELDGWDEDISNVKKFAELPKAAQNYVKFIEKF